MSCHISFAKVFSLFSLYYYNLVPLEFSIGKKERTGICEVCMRCKRGVWVQRQDLYYSMSTVVLVISLANRCGELGFPQWVFYAVYRV